MDIPNEQRYPTPYATSPLLPLLLLSLTAQKHTPNIKSTFEEEYDYVVVGAGSAGSVVASRLSEVECVSVLLLEAGNTPPMLTDIPALARYFLNTDLDWQYKTTPQKYTASGLNDRQLPWPSGKTMGGSSVINAMVYVRGNRRNYDKWAGFGATGWSYKDVFPYFLKLENNTDPHYLLNGFHDAGGPITASRPTYYPKKKRASRQATPNTGYHFVDSNAYEQIGFYDHQATIKEGQRCSAAKGYLVPSEKRTNLDILANAPVTKIIIENKQATGVEFEFKGKTRRVKATKEVILSAGSIKTPQILMASGIGPKSELKKFNIPIVADLPVGLNLQDQLASLLIFTVDDSLPRFNDEVLKKENILKYIHKKVGPLTSTEGIFFMSFLNSGDSEDKIPDYSLYFADVQDILATQLGFKDEILAKVFLPLANRSTIVCVSQLLHPRSRGTVSLQSANPLDQPLIDPNYFSDARDKENIVQGLKTCQKIFKNRALKKINARPITTPIPGCEKFVKDNDLYLNCVVETLVFTLSHYVGTCRMGESCDPRTVVDPLLRVKGIKSLRVVDASVMPKIPWGNTNIPTIMVAEKASDIIKRTIHCDSD